MVVGVGGMQPCGFVHSVPSWLVRTVITRRFVHPALSQYLRPIPAIIETSKRRFH